MNAPIIESIIQSSDHTIEICGPETGHSVRPIAYCDSANRAKELVHRFKSHNELVAALKQAAMELEEASHIFGGASMHGQPMPITSELYTHAAEKARAILAKTGE